MPSEWELPPSTLAQRFHVAARFALVVAAGVPTTTFPPLILSQALTRRFRREERLKRLHKMVPWARFSARKILGIDMRIVGREHLPRPSRGHLYVSNHQSYVDILVLMDALDTVAFLSKSLVRHIPVLGRSAWCGGTVFLERTSPADRERALQETLRMCHESTAVVLFPEGTRSDDGRLRPKIHRRGMAEAWRHGLRVVPIGLDGTGLVVPKSMDRIQLGRPVEVHIGPPIDPADFADGEAFADRCWSAVSELFDEARAARLARDDRRSPQ